jgi:ribokinase
MKALTIGGATIDTIAIIESDRIERVSMFNAETSFLLLEEGRKTESAEVSTHCGGGAVNSAIAMVRLGLATATLVKLGDDERARVVTRRLAEEGISLQWIRTDPTAPTGASVHVSSHERNAAVFTFRGANTLLRSADLDADAFAVDVVYVSNLSGGSADCYAAIVTKAKAAGALLVVNPGIRQLTARAGEFLDSLAHVDIVAINRTEADALVASLVGRFGETGPALDHDPERQAPALIARGLIGGGFRMSLPAFLSALHRLGPRYVVLTDSRCGAFVHADSELLFCPAVATKVAGTAGAGDAFAATFAAYITLGRSCEAALQAATVNAASVVAHVDTQTGLMRQQAIDSALANHTSLQLRRWRLQATGK